ncbi:MAG: serine/threonine-protein kinase [Acidobacteriota bacterium]
MSNQLERLEEVERHFHAALELSPAERRAYLREQAPATLRPQLERLLAADAETLARPQMSAPGGIGREGGGSRGGPPGLEPGTLVGPYRIEDQIGVGGFGAVYRAQQQEPFTREVALKVIRPGLGGPDVLARFDAERQALALMDHPGIARVLDAGTADAGPFVVMELVRGPTITRHAIEMGTSIEERLHLFLDVCRAVQHAHQKGVLHRDLKPSNVLVHTDGPEASGAPGRPKVIDFGIAKAFRGQLTDKTLDSARYRVLGTPAYMSPEQARGEVDIDTRSDVYSLGALLYELLTGRPPFEADRLSELGLTDMLRVVIEEEPPPPSACLGEPDRRKVRGELDWIVSKALEKDRRRRYASVSEFGADIERLLTGAPVLAGPVSRRYRLQKFVSRHRLPVALAAVLFIALTAGVIGTGFGLLEASTQRDVARLEAERARAATDFLVETVALADPEIALDPNLSIRTLLDRAGARVADGTRGQPSAEARVRSALGRAYESQGEHALAEQHLRRAVAIHDGASEDVLPPPELYATLWTLTHVLFRLELPDAQEVAHRARQLAHDMVRRRHVELAAALDEMTRAIRSGAHLPEEEPVTRALDAAARAEALAADLDPKDRTWALVADSCMDAGFSLWYSPHEGRSGPFFRCATEARRRFLPAGHPDIGESVSMWVGVLTRAGEMDAAESLARGALDELRSTFGDDNFQVAFAKARLGESLGAQGRFAEAEPLLLESHDVLLRGSGGPATFFPIDSHSRLIQLYRAWGRPDEERKYRRALADLGARSTWPVAWAMMRWVFEPDEQPLVDAVDRFVGRVGLIAYSARPGELPGDSGGEATAEVRAIAAHLSALPLDAPRTLVVARLLVASTNAFAPGADVRPETAALALSYLEGQPGLHLDRAEARSLSALGYSESSGSAPGDRVAALDQAFADLEAHDAETDGRGDAWFTANAKARIGRAAAELGDRWRARVLLEDAAATLRLQLGEGNRDYLAVATELRALDGES